MITQIVIGFIEKIYILVFMWGILQFEFQKEVHKSIMAVFLFFLSEFSLYNGVHILWICLQTIGVNILFEDLIVKKSMGFWFSYFYAKVIHTFIKEIIGWGAMVMALEDNKVVISGLAGIIVTFVFWQIGIYVKSQKQRVFILKEMSVSYYFAGILCGMIGNIVNNFTMHFFKQIIYFFPIFIETCIHIVTFCFCILCMAFIFLHMFYQQYKKEYEKKEQYLNILKRYLKEQKNYINEVRAIKHDIQAHKGVVRNYLELGKEQKALTYLRKMIEVQSLNNRQFYDVGNEVVNFIIYEKIHQSHIFITIDCIGTIPKSLSISDYDLCTIFSNLLSNSVEACEHLKVYKKQIRLELKQYKNNFCIVIQNPIEWKVNIDKIEMISTKKDNKSHGYGLLNVKKAVLKYKGEIEFNSEENMFEVRILFYNVIGK